MPAAQWVPACAGMTADGVRGDKGKVSLRDKRMPAAQWVPACAGMTADGAAG